MPSKRCPSCGRMHDVEVVVCDCGENIATPVREITLIKWLRMVTLNIAMVLSVLGAIYCVVMLGWGLYKEGVTIAALYFSLAFVQAVAMAFVFRHVDKNSR